MVSKYFEMSTSTTQRSPNPTSMKPLRRSRNASWAERSGRKPYEHGRKSVS
jgi:hypothetical protein